MPAARSPTPAAAARVMRSRFSMPPTAPAARMRATWSRSESPPMTPERLVDAAAHCSLATFARRTGSRMASISLRRVAPCVAEHHEAVAQPLQSVAEGIDGVCGVVQRAPQRLGALRHALEAVIGLARLGADLDQDLL
jgi:hypothetical protein